jgi:hypothetical protein
MAPRTESKDYGQKSRTLAPDGPRDIDAAIGHRDRVEEPHRGRSPFGEGPRCRCRLGQERIDQQDPEDERHVAEDLDIDRHQPGHEPVLRQTQDARQHAQHRGKDAAQHRDKQGVRDPDQRRAPVGHAAVIGDQHLVDVIPGPLRQKAEADVLAKIGKVLDEVRDQIVEQGRQQRERDHLDRDRPVARVVNELG